MKGISIWIWVIGGIIIGFLMFMVSLQFINYITLAKEKEVGRESLDELASNVNGLCSSRAGDSISKTFLLPDKVSVVYAAKDTKFSSNASRTYGSALCIIFSNEIICNNLNCNLEMETINNHESLQTLLNQFLGSYGTNSYSVKILKTDCGVAVLSPSSQTTCTVNNTLT